MRGRRYFGSANGDTIVAVGALDATVEERASALRKHGTGAVGTVDRLLDDLLSDCLQDPARCRDRLMEIGGMELEDTRWYSPDELRCEVADRLSGPETSLIVRRRHPRYHLPPRRLEPEVATPAIVVAKATAEPNVAITRIDSSCFVPGLEDVGIDYQIVGPLSKVRALHLAIASEAAPDQILFEVEIPGAGSHAQGTYRWDGATQLSGGVVTLKGSPYEAQLTLTSTSGQLHESNRAQVAVEVHSLEIEVADPESAGVPQRHRKPLSDLRAQLLADRSPGGAHGRLIRTNPRFKSDYSEMYGDGSIASYRERWEDDEYLVPLVLQVWLRGKKGDRRRAPKVTEGTRVLWRVSLRDGAELDDVLASRPVHADARHFIKAANAHGHARCRPAGWAAHREAGGLKAEPDECSRGAPVERRFRGTDWPHGEPKNRPWDLFTQCGDYSFTLEGDSGASLRVGHVAGDACQVTAILDQHESLDVAEEDALDGIPGVLRSNSITIENWRHIPVVRQLSLARGKIDWEKVQRQFSQAAVVVGPRPDSRVEDFTEQWAHYYRKAVEDLLPKKVAFGHAILDSPAPYPVRFRDFDDYWARLEPGLGWVRRAFTRSSAESKYQKNCDDWATDVCHGVTRKMAAAEILNDGITAITFDTNRMHNQERGPRTVGLAPDIGASDRAVVLIFNAGNVDAATTAIHEIGHAMFLAHAPGFFDPDEPPAGVDPTAHAPDQSCLMSYDPRAINLCGLCLLKLAVWDPTKINTDGTLHVP